jgi:hypothetical protein
VDKVDLVIGGYGTNTVLPEMRLIMERQRFFVGLMGSASTTRSPIRSWYPLGARAW